jgi:nicotinate-nucleotide pyrophosphorylase (carboxylating)
MILEPRGYTNPVLSLDEEDYRILVSLALREDSPDGDITSDSLFSRDSQTQAMLVSREPGILCGLGAVFEVNRQTGNELRLAIDHRDGEILQTGTLIGILSGPTRTLLRVERVLLNFLQYLSGIATQTNEIVKKYPNLKILDTRKTLPGYRKLVKYAVYKGGGWNHRIHLSDMAMIKDNHIQAWGSIRSAVDRIRSTHPGKKVELEIDSLAQLAEALASKPDILLLDNFSVEDTKTALQAIESESEIESGYRPLVEVSGGITPAKLEALSELGNIGVSMGYLTHTTRFLDIGLDMENT